MQRNPQNQVKMGPDYVKRGESTTGGVHGKTLASGSAGVCPKCKTEIQPKPGFRISALKCPKCGTSIGKK